MLQILFPANNVAVFHRRKKILVSGISRSISKIFSKGGRSQPPIPPAYTYVFTSQ
jgi:hypothetical protein